MRERLMLGQIAARLRIDADLCRAQAVGRGTRVRTELRAAAAVLDWLGEALARLETVTTHRASVDGGVAAREVRS